MEVREAGDQKGRVLESLGGLSKAEATGLVAKTTRLLQKARSELRRTLESRNAGG
jgi:ElaB/YqjD/DUF883 family membrane-anchored ribosome-binding protein